MFLCQDELYGETDRLHSVVQVHLNGSREICINMRVKTPSPIYYRVLLITAVAVLTTEQ